MCGIFGLVQAPRAVHNAYLTKEYMTALYQLSESRGKEAAGLAILLNEHILVHKDTRPASQMLRSKAYQQIIQPAIAQNPHALLGHTRLVTNGLHSIPSNNQPIIYNDIVLLHNGIIVNDQEIWESLPQSYQARSNVDSEAAAAWIDHECSNGASFCAAVASVMQRIYGESSFAVLSSAHDEVILATNTGSIYTVTLPDGSIAFASERYIIKTFIERFVEIFEGHACSIVQVRSGMVGNIKLNTDRLILLARTISDTLHVCDDVTHSPKRQIKSTTRSSQEVLTSLARCNSCLLPSTMPFIEFDADGVCNYCQHHKKMHYHGEDALEQTLAKYRKNNGEPDCLVAFSGGRDSSYGLHLLKTKYKMNPIAYTYDWGMVTDLARRNQARMCHKLGIEHIWVSANIKSKRRNIARNVSAWTKNPDLGMVPLFMAGDKQFFHYANVVMDQTGIDLMILCENPLEKTCFKSGFCGIAPDHGQKSVYSLSLLNKLKMLKYYFKQFIKNPRYINLSLIDTCSAFISYYFAKHPFLSLFEYIPWNETEVNRVLIEEYQWETAPDSVSTWRIGDGTAPFYNYIYNTIAGFTEYETFRSNQVREGLLTREQAWDLLQKENQPRFEGIREYAQLIGVDFDTIMQAIQQTPKLYEQKVY